MKVATATLGGTLAFTAALAIPILGESLHIHQGVGIALIFSGIYLSTTSGAAGNPDHRES